MVLKIVGLLAGGFATQAQQLHYSIHPTDTPAKEALDALGGKVFYDSALLMSALEKVVTNLRNQGHLLASYQQLGWSHDTLQGSLSSGNKHLLIVEGLSTRKKPLKTSTPGAGYRRGLQRELEQYVNNGYPFAKVYFDSSYQKSDTLFVRAQVQKGPFIVFDTLQVQGAEKTRMSFLQKFLAIVPGAPYSEKLVREIPARLNASGYLQTPSTPIVDFYSGKAQVTIQVEELEVNQLDGILGFLPGQNPDTDKLLITGQLKADLYNLLGSGKQLYLDWQNFSAASQQLQAAYNHPVLLGSPLTLHASFRQLKQDTAFINRQAALEFSLPLSARYSARFGANFRRNGLLAEAAATEGGRLTNADSRLNEYSLGILYSTLNRIQMPTSGTKIQLAGAVGQKEVIRNASLDPAFYDGVLLSSLQSSIAASVENYTGMRGGSVFVQDVRLGTIINKQLFQNDLYRVGGLTDGPFSLRGFNQNQFYTRSFALLVLEWRFLLDQQSYLVGFADQGVLSVENDNVLYAVGFGGGLLLNVNAGFFRIAVAAGGGSSQAIDLTQPKIHFGFVNRF